MVDAQHGESGAEGRLALPTEPREDVPTLDDLKGQDRAGIQVGHQETRQREPTGILIMTPAIFSDTMQLARPSLVDSINAARKQCTPPGEQTPRPLPGIRFVASRDLGFNHDANKW